MMRQKHAGVKTKNRDVRDPDREFKAAMHRTSDGAYGFPSGGIKKCLLNAAHKDIGIEKTLLRKSLFIIADADSESGEPLCLMDTTDPIMREDVVRVGMGSTDLRYRPEFKTWAIELTLQYDGEALTPENILNIFQRAGFGVGLGEWRPEKAGEYGRFAIDVGFPIETNEVVI
tara:strand:+ start:451 stop:969 length:519 start_codon:yes stop_codon:yes gene_type:complete